MHVYQSAGYVMIVNTESKIGNIISCWKFS